MSYETSDGSPQIIARVIIFQKPTDEMWIMIRIWMTTAAAAALFGNKIEYVELLDGYDN